MKRLPVLLLLIAIFCWGKTANAVPFSSFEKNVEALNESLLMTTSMLVQSYGVSSSNLTFSGAFQETSWSANMNGVYAGMSLNLSFVGTFNVALDQGSFTSTGTLGTSSWSGGGNWSFFDVDAQTISMLWDSDATITPSFPGGSVLKPDKHFTAPGKQWAYSLDGTEVTDSGTYKSTIGGLPFGEEEKEISNWVFPKDRPRTASVTVLLPDDFVVLREVADFDSGTLNGTIDVPEPASFFLVLVGIFGLVCQNFRRRSVQPQGLSSHQIFT